MNEPTGEWDALPIMLTIDEAARVLRIGRSKAYEMAATYTSSGGTHGLACLRLGDLLRVPKFALHEYVTTGHIVQLIPQHDANATADATADATVDATAARTPARKPRVTDRAQLSLLGSD
jgi:excisionase family DNA binding protein